MKKACRSRLSLVILVWATVHLTLLLGVSCDHLATTEEQYVNPSQALPMNPQEVKTMAWQGETYLWVGNRAGVGRINRVEGSIEIFDNVACPRLFLTSIGIWCSTVNYINKYDGKTWHRFDLEAYQIIEADDGTLWAGTKEGLAYFDIARQDWKYELKVSRRTSSKFIFKTGSGIQLAFQTSDGALWFYSYSKDYTGVTRWTEISHNTWLPIGDHVMVQPMLETRDGIIWGAGDDGSVSRWDGQQWQVWYPFRLRPAIADIIESQNGDIWVLATADGVGHWNGQDWQVWSRDEAFLQNCPGAARGQECFSIQPDAEYYSANGLGKANPNQPRLSLTALLETQDGSIWVGTAQEGVSRWDGTEWRNYTTADGLSSEAITILIESPDGILWAGTWGGGVNYYDPDIDQWYPFP